MDRKRTNPKNTWYKRNDEFIEICMNIMQNAQREFDMKNISTSYTVDMIDYTNRERYSRIDAIYLHNTSKIAGSIKKDIIDIVTLGVFHHVLPTTICHNAPLKAYVQTYLEGDSMKNSLLVETNQSFESKYFLLKNILFQHMNTIDEFAMQCQRNVDISIQIGNNKKELLRTR